MTRYALAALIVAAAYLIGSIPFAYLIVRLVKGIDIRSVGSGNVGATNAGRVLGFRYFVVVFLLDLLKGLLPTLGLPRLMGQLTGSTMAGLPVLVALATILGHNFPVFLKFRGGKGVATSLGAVSALDAVASGATFLAFLTFLLVTRVVSISSVLAGVVFVAVHFAQVRDPWGKDQIVMSLATLALLGMLIARHRANFARLAAGTEPRISFRRRDRKPNGRIGLAVLGIIAVAGIGGAIAARSLQVDTLDCGEILLVAEDRVATGHQRAERVAFLDDGRLLGVLCPRYNRVVLYRVMPARRLVRHRDIRLDGRPVALAGAGRRFYVLQRPAGDARHVEEAFWQAFDHDGRPDGGKLRVGFDPDDLAIAPDGKYAYVVNSGHAEGETNRPAPALLTVDLKAAQGPRICSRIDLPGPSVDPERLVLSASGHSLAISDAGSNQLVSVDLSDPARPAVRGKRALSADGKLAFDADDELLASPLGLGRDAAVLGGLYCVATLPKDSGIEILRASGAERLGTMTLHGPGNLSPIRPTSVAVDPTRRLLAVANRSGGVHLIAVRRKTARP